MEAPKPNPLTNTPDSVMRNVVRDCEKNWGVRPVIILACQDAADEHWQVWHPDIHGKEDGQPHFTIDKEAECFQHVF